MKISFNQLSLPSVRIATPQQAVKNLTKIAVPLMVLAAVASTQQAQAITMQKCFENCDKHRDAHELAKLICYALCAWFSEKR